MAAELITPRDETTGMPLPLAIPDSYISVDNPDAVNWHHHFHPASAPELQSLGGSALRSVRVQLVPENLHNMGDEYPVYHSLFKGPELPDANDAETQFLFCVLACAGYVPRQAIDVTADDPTVPITLSDTQMRTYKTTRQPASITVADIRRFIENKDQSLTPREAWRAITIRNKRQAAFSYRHFRYSYDPVKTFFGEFLLTQDIDINTKSVKRFLRTSDEAKRQALGETILSQIAEQTTGGFRDTYSTLHESGALHPLMPAKPDRLVFRKLGNHAQRSALLPRLQDQLTTLYG